MKKVINIIGILLLTVVGLHLLFGMYVWISNSVYLENINQSNVAYLRSNKVSSPNDKIKENFFKGVFDEEFYNSNIFLLGENHGFSDVQKIDLALVKHLQKEVGLGFYIAEMEFSLGNKLNTYINDSIQDQALLSEVVTKMKERIPQQASQEFYNKWEEIRKFNLGLPDSQRITVLGIDKEPGIDQEQVSRDSAMFKNLNRYIHKNNLKDEKFYGLFGYFHVMQKPIGKNTVEPFASRLASSNIEHFRNVKSMVVYHLDSEVYFPENSQFPTPESEKIGFLNDDGPISLVKGINDLEEVTEAGSITLF